MSVLQARADPESHLVNNIQETRAKSTPNRAMRNVSVSAVNTPAMGHWGT